MRVVDRLVRLFFFLLVQQQAHSYDSAAYKDPHYADGRTTMVHLFEWKFKDIAEECERFLGPMGFAAVQVSPISECLLIEEPPRPWYERYQPISYKIASRSGSEDEFRDMVGRCNRVGVRTFVDVVMNHMTGDADPAVGVAGSTADPRTRLYPAVPYGLSDFNELCAINSYQDPNEVRNCELSGLHDLNQAVPNVRDKIVEFVNRAIDHGIAGIRVDGAKHMWPTDLEQIYKRLNNLSREFFPPNLRPFIYQEVIDLGFGEGSKRGDYTHLGTVIEFVYGSELGRKFRGYESLDTLETWGFRENGLLDSEDAVVMVDNHDNQRGHGAGGRAILNYKVPRLYKMAVAFMLAHPYGWTRLMSSFNFTDPSQGPPTDEKGDIISPDPFARGPNVANPCNHGWVCEHRWPEIQGMLRFRNDVGPAVFANWWSNGNNQIAFSRGNRGFIAFNGQYGIDLSQELQTGMPAGKYCDVISGSNVNGRCTGKTVTVKPNGRAFIVILKNEQNGVVAIHTKVITIHVTS
ncbi:alpha-amylase B-like [Copidosoma floridanum]|uniref:alpha-amylase B-like n=1 Tax=Copidosoma floridanum TaxID=29053 RepID=UPI0006C95458|nr:alpha-amylase B-like [Copidosoma floridanum]